MLSMFFIVFTIILFAYLAWRVLYLLELDRDEIFGYVFLAPLVFLLVARLSQAVLFWNVWELRLLDIVGFWRKPGFEVLFGYVAMTMFSLYWCWVKKWKVNIILEELRWPLLVFWLAWVLYNLATLETIDMGNMLYAFGVLPAFVVDLLLFPRYKRVWWYPSGKKGLMFWILQCTVIMVYLIGSILLRIFGINFYISWLLLVLCLAPLVWLGRI